MISSQLIYFSTALIRKRMVYDTGFYSYDVSHTCLVALSQSLLYNI